MVLYQNSPNVVYNPPQITVNSHPLNSLEQFTYLGNIISNDASNTKDVDHRLTKASSSFGHLQHRVWQNHSLHLMTKVRVYVAVVISTLLYAAETWVLYRKHIQLLEHFRQPEVLALHHGNTLAGLRHQRRGSRMGWTAKISRLCCTSTPPLSPPCHAHKRHQDA